MTLARSERAALADLFVTLGPDQPTLDEGWQTKDLLIHLLIRERSPLGAAGTFVSPLKGFTEKAEAEYAAKPWAELIQTYRSGPPGWNPMGWGKLEELTNGSEMFIHHEDARRGQDGWQPRELDADATAQLAKMVSSGLGKLSVRKSPVGIVVQLPGRPPVTLKSGEPAVTVTGDPAEVLLWLSGRDACRVELTGDPEALRQVRELQRGM